MRLPPDEPPQPVISLEYGSRGTDAVWAITRFVAAFVALQGAATAASSLWSAFRLTYEAANGFPNNGMSDLVVRGVEVLKAGGGVGLVVGGLLARSRQRAGPRCCMAFEAAVAALFIAESAVWSYQLRLNGTTGQEAVVWDVDYALSTVVELALPALVWAYFRRSDVRAVFEG